MKKITFKLKPRALIANIFWNLGEKTIILTTLSPNTVTGYYKNLREVIGLKLSQLKINPKFKIPKPNSQCWYIYEVASSEAMTDLTLLTQYSEDTIVFFSNDIELKSLNKWVTYSSSNFMPDKVFVDEPEWVLSLCKYSLWFGIGTEYGSDDVTFVSDDENLLHVFDQSLKNHKKHM